MRHYLLSLLLFISSAGLGQYKNDNVKYKTVFLEDFCATIKNNRDYILLDVRSPGEYADTSSSNYLNIGRLKNALNIPVDELPKRLEEIRKYSYTLVVIYCSHSQRSRRASAMLADSGFTNVMNLNGGLTFFNQYRDSQLPCASEFYQTGNVYKFIPAPQLLARLKNRADLFLLDIRKDSVFKGISQDEALNASGTIKEAVNIPLPDLAGRLSELPSNKSIVIIDDGGNESPKAAGILTSQGYKNLSLVFNGMNMWNATPLAEMKGKEKHWRTPYNFKMITADDFNELAKTAGSLIVDVRSGEEYNNKAKENWRNRGNIKGARSIPFNSFESRYTELNDHKNSPVILYHFSSQPEVFKAAKMLSENGYKNVNVLIGGIWNLNWRAANLKNKKELDSWVENIPPGNL